MNKKKIIALVVAAICLATAMGGCRASDPPKTAAPATSSPPAGNQTGQPPATGTGEVSQGVTDTEILIGTIAVTSGVFAYIGQPAYDGLKACIDRLNAQGGVRGRQIRLVTYDDQGDIPTGKAYVEKMVEEDKVFALASMGGNIVESSLQYLIDKGIPVVNMLAGGDEIYSESNPGSRIFPIIPSYNSDGRYLASRVLHESIFGPNKDQKLPDDAKIGVATYINEYEQTILDGLLEQAALEGATDRFVVETVAGDTAHAAIQKFKDEGCQATILIPLASEWYVSFMEDAQWEVPLISSFGNSTIANYIPDTYKANRPIYATIWSDLNTEKGQALIEDMMDALTYNPTVDEATRQFYRTQNYCLAGYCYGITLATALDRFNQNPDLDLTWENFTTLMESEPFFWGDASWSYADGRRMGIDTMALFEYLGDPVAKTETFEVIRTFETIEEVMAK
ncbi:MAG: ABC transporter substrate-binding protein [Oscillospiraceae bacterium]|jgi:hypothetical protein|nr:ABC transporter substrate-binding protein [Oscillospiraceae bacterium]